jgi:energy-coupling factor transporter ATP-binding protein EcfA2
LSENIRKILEMKRAADRERILGYGRAVMGYAEDPFSPNPPYGFVDGDIKIGSCAATNAPFGLLSQDLTQHTLITGRSGSGKTTLIYLILAHLIQRRIPVFAFDFKRDYRHLLQFTPNLLVFDPYNFLFNPLRPPTGVMPDTWMNAFVDVFAFSYMLRTGGKPILRTNIEKLYHDYGVFSGSDKYPTMLDLLESLDFELKHKKYGGGRKIGYLEGCHHQIESCVQSLKKIVNVDRGYSIEQLLDTNVVLELEGGLSQDHSSFLISIILRYVFQYRISNNQQGPLKHIFLFDEASIVFDKVKEHKENLGSNEIAKFPKLVREFGEGLIAADQMPSRLSESIWSNVVNVLCLSQSPAQINTMSQALRLSHEQTAALQGLIISPEEGIFQGIAQIIGRWDRPFIFNIQPINLKKPVTDSHVQDLMRPKLEQLQDNVVPRTEYSQILKQKKAEEEAAKKAETKRKPQSRNQKLRRLNKKSLKLRATF